MVPNNFEVNQMKLYPETKHSKQTQKEIEVFCQNVKTLRERYDLNEKEMAKILEIGAANLTKIEQGIMPHRVSVSIVIKLSQHFSIEPRRLFTPL